MLLYEKKPTNKTGTGKDLKNVSADKNATV